MEIVTRAIFDCLNEEIVLLNEDIEEDAILSSIKNLISEECVEFREDTVGNDRMASGGQNNGGSSNHVLTRTGDENSCHRHEILPKIESTGKEKDKVDSKRSDPLAARNYRSNQNVPNLIVFEPKRRRRNPYGEETPSLDRTSTTDLNNGYFSTNRVNSHQMKPGATNKNNLKLYRWMKRGKRGLLTITKTRPPDRRLRSGLGEF